MAGGEAFNHRASRMARVSLGLRTFLVASMFVGGAVLGAGKLSAPATIAVECDRGAGRCVAGSQWAWGEPRSVAVDRLAELAALRDGRHAALALMVDGRPNYWGGEVGDPEEIAALDRGVEQLRAFVGGAQPAIRVEVPNGSPAPPWGALVVMLVVGVWQLITVRKTIARSALVVDRAAGTASLDVRRWFALPAREALPLAAVRAVETVNTRSGVAPSRYAYTVVALRVDGRPAVLAVAEYTSPGSASAARSLAEGLGAALGVPVEGS